MVRIYTNIDRGEAWIDRYKGKKSGFACVLGFTETGLIPGISAAGSTPFDRRYTALADAEFLYYGAKKKGQYPLPPLIAGVSPVFITRAVVESLDIPVYLFNAGLLESPTVPTINLQGVPAKCLSLGAAMDLAAVERLFSQGTIWGERLARDNKHDYLVIGECVVGGTTTALAILTGLGITARGMVNSSHPVCNHEQKWEIVQAGLGRMEIQGDIQNLKQITPLQLVAGVGDPMQIAVAGMAIAASRFGGVLLAGGTQMLAVFALAEAIARYYNLPWQPEEVVVGTTRWVAEDATGKTIELVERIKGNSAIAPALLATELCFADSRYPQLKAYEQGFVKEGMGAGGACIAAYLSKNWQQQQLLAAIEAQIYSYFQR